jgi:hypothetical protein
MCYENRTTPKASNTDVCRLIGGRNLADLTEHRGFPNPDGITGRYNADAVRQRLERKAASAPLRQFSLWDTSIHVPCGGQGEAVRGCTLANAAR